MRIVYENETYKQIVGDCFATFLLFAGTAYLVILAWERGWLKVFPEQWRRFKKQSKPIQFFIVALIAAFILASNKMLNDPQQPSQKPPQQQTQQQQQSQPSQLPEIPTNQLARAQYIAQVVMTDIGDATPGWHTNEIPSNAQASKKWLRGAHYDFERIVLTNGMTLVGRTVTNLFVSVGGCVSFHAPLGRNVAPSPAPSPSDRPHGAKDILHLLDSPALSFAPQPNANPLAPTHQDEVMWYAVSETNILIRWQNVSLSRLSALPLTFECDIQEEEIFYRYHVPAPTYADSAWNIGEYLIGVTLSGINGEVGGETYAHSTQSDLRPLTLAPTAHCLFPETVLPPDWTPGQDVEIRFQYIGDLLTDAAAEGDFTGCGLGDFFKIHNGLDVRRPDSILPGVMCDGMVMLAIQVFALATVVGSSYLL